MSTKRAATTELNHDNWDQDDPSEHEEMGTFKAAPKEVLEKRVIRTAKRRAQPSGDEPNKSVFSGFGGFNKSQPSSFDFLSKLTNGNKGKPEEPPKTSSGLFSNLAANSMSSTNGGPFGMPMTSTPSKSVFGVPTSQSPAFGSPNSSAASSSFFTTNKTNNTEIPMFKGPSNDSKDKESTITPKSTASVFGSFSSKPAEAKNTPFSIQPQVNTNKTDKQTDKKGMEEKPAVDEKKLTYYGKLKGLNESVSDWIKKHVQETPLCILSPILKDYEKYLKEIQDECYGTDNTSKANEMKEHKPNSEDSVKPAMSGSSFATSKALNAGLILEAKKEVSPWPPGYKFGVGKMETVTEKTGETTTSAGFSFHSNTSTTALPHNKLETFGEKLDKLTTSAGFSFGGNTTTTSSLFSSTNTTNANGTTSFSFGTKFPFNSNAQQKPAEDTAEANEEDEPPKVEYKPVVEDNSIFEKKCKIFVKKDGNFADKGVGTLYIKTVEGSGKHQLLIRANTNLGNVLLNLILTSDTPTQRLGKNNVMIVCIPTPDSKPPPVPILIRVKTSEEADELLETLNKYKA